MAVCEKDVKASRGGKGKKKRKTTKAAHFYAC